MLNRETTNVSYRPEGLAQPLDRPRRRRMRRDRDVPDALAIVGEEHQTNKRR